jgi:hypothetical protein
MMTLWDSKLAVLQANFPKVKVVAYPDHWLLKWPWKLGWRMGATTLYNTIVMAPEYIGTDTGAELLVHEAVHVVDQHVWHILFFLSYFILPVGPSFKAFWEWRAYKTEIRRAVDGGYWTTKPTEDWIIKQFCGPSYGWMWPFPNFWRKKIQAYIKQLRGQANAA